MFLNRNIGRAALILILSVFIGASLGAQDAAVDYSGLIEEEVLTGYQDLMSERLDLDVPDLTWETWFIIAQAINKGYLRFTVDPEDKPLIQGAEFLVVPESGQPYIFITGKLLDSWDVYPTLTYTLLSGAFREAYLFFRDTAMWRAAKADVIESAFMRMEKYAAEVSMVRDRLVPSGYLITPYETYILDSFETDGMTSGMMFLNGQSMPVARAFGDLRIAYEESRDDEALRAAILDTGRELLKARNELPAEAADQEIFPLAVAIHSWLEMTPSMISRIHNIDRPSNPLVFPEVLIREPEYEDLRRLLEATRTRDLPLMEYIVDESIMGFSMPD